MKLAQLNIALAKYPLDAPEIKEFVDNLELVNGIAESSEGFVWRLKDESGDATNIQAFDDPNMIVNMSVWDSVDSLKNFMFRTHHRDFMRRKGDWFHRLPEDTYVLWWIEEDHIPTLEEAIERLEHLREIGDTPYAFTFKTNFTASEVPKQRS
ncbi:DUF3291 domain-containing protein [Vibrio splendidus]|jgi:hypothetical protein|uniref:DUF3291 domain-containing protein n=2 Tax=Vibrio TaxID=662 RepID=A0ABD5A5G6_VIBSP|nr:DUF3291 domain-containing protein [Vibrio splendidus]MBT9239446.1 DUF3291 domain-containing protein [Vibrio splendidus]MDH5888815.1 DUF3291 domain-containing protein [Vibrio splendidus]MDP2488478.1 DUF3291 domain-containing protein [Vibrio splendidus]MDP2616634.1 DUF3291 domain-containing protein [Vibrio splendidus]OEF44635.1 hypothetical protein A150_13375 [Vibrio splendidus 1S-124]